MPKMPEKKTATKSTASAAPPKAKEKPKSETRRKVVYDHFYVSVLVGDKALIEEQAKAILGWQEETEEIKFDKNFLCVDYHGKKIRCLNNAHNRPYKHVRSKTWASETLKRNWKLNGENLIIGEFGSTLSAQHRLIGFILACQEWREDKSKWPEWKKQPTMECSIAFGVKEDDATVNTIDTGDPRSLSDVLYRSEYFSDVADSAREKISAIADKCIKHLRYRVGGDINAHSPRQTHAMSLDFLERHPTILKCVKAVHEHNGEKALTTYIPLGIGSALMYLMATSASDGKKYRENDPPREKDLDFSAYSKAEEFFISLAAGTKEFAAFRGEFQELKNAELDRNAEKQAILIKAWEAMQTSKVITKEAIKLEFEIGDDMQKILVSAPTCGGIDLGDPKDAPDPDEEPAPADIAQEKKEEKTNKAGTTEIVKGSTVFVVDPATPESEWKGIVEEILDIPKKPKRAKVKATHPKSYAGRSFEIPFSFLKPA